MRNKLLNLTRLNKLILLIVVNVIITNNLFGQDRIESLKTELTEMSKDIPELNAEVNLSFDGVSIQDFVRAIALNVGLNINVDPNINIVIVSNFNKVKVIDVLIFLCKEYNLTINSIGSILTVSEYEERIISKPEVKKQQKDKIKFNNQNNLISIDATEDTLLFIAREITDKTGKNLAIAPGLGNMLVSAYIKDMSFDDAMKTFAFGNNLNVSKPSDNFYLIEKIDQSKKSESSRFKKGTSNEENNIIELDDDHKNEIRSKINIRSKDYISLTYKSAPIDFILREITSQLGINYVYLNPIAGEKDINVMGVTFDELLNYLFDGTEFTYIKQDHIYIFGLNTNKELTTSKVIQLKYRTIDKIIDYIPAGISEGLELKEFPELNSVIVTGSSIKIATIENFLKDIDKIVPVILIEVLIIDVTKTHDVSTGIDAGLGESVSKTTGSIYPSVDVQLSSETINNLINSFNGFGWFNLGQVSSDFYMKIKALEEDGFIDIRSTPKLSTINGHEAILTSGETKYYKEERNNYIGTQNPSLSSSFTWQSVNADLTVKIKPFVSGNDQITLDITVQQSEFTPREFENSPPGSVTRNFESSIRVKNGEMVLLGGLEKNQKSQTTKGFPLLSRIPILKWLFSSVNDIDDESKLNVFIQPTILY